jgi:malonate-semialdehyde dehydrogenase (acetylating)/methylmalonate-semialdehyde dehydrogenase
MAADAEMGPVVSSAAKQRIERLISEGVEQGAKLVVDGRNYVVPDARTASSSAVLCSITSPDMTHLQGRDFRPGAVHAALRT